MDTAFKILEELDRAGHKAYIVGGAVRDRLLGVPQKDIDIVTLAFPGEIAAVAEANGWTTHEVGLSFGVVVVVVEGKPYEVASARTERYGEDSHRPEEVSFVQDISLDLARRDFTINAMAMDMTGRLTDPFGGREDLRKKTIRAVGDPRKRFEEDGLRLFRAVRFASQLGFDIEEETLAAFPDTLHRVEGLSVERVRDELEKILVSPYPSTGLKLLLDTGLAGCSCISKTGDHREKVEILPELVPLRGLEQNPRYHRFDVWEHTLAVVEAVRPDPVLRWAALLHDIAKGTKGVRCLNKRGEPADYGHDRKGAEIAFRVLERLKAPKALSERVSWLVRHHMLHPGPEYAPVRKWLIKRAADFRNREELTRALHQLALLRRADMSGGKASPDLSRVEALEKTIEEVLRETPFFRAELEIKGEEIARELGEGSQVKEFMDYLLDRVQRGQLPNQYTALLDVLKKKANTAGV